MKYMIPPIVIAISVFHKDLREQKMRNKSWRTAGTFILELRAGNATIGAAPFMRRTSPRMDQAMRGWLEPEDVVDTRFLKDIRKLFKR